MATFETDLTKEAITKKIKTEQSKPLGISPEDRVFGSDSQAKQKFKILTIDSPEKWAAADEFTCQYKMPILGGNKFISIHCGGISYQAWEELELEFPIPEPPKNEETGKKDENDSVFQAKRRSLISQKKLKLFEISTGKKIPGDTTEEKERWLHQRNSGEIDSLYLYIYQFAAATADGNNLKAYQAVSKTSQVASITEFKDFADWEVAANSSITFQFERPFEDYIIELPLKNLSAEEKQKIEDASKIPEPPRIILKNPQSGRLDPNLTEPNYSDPGWQKKFRATNQRRLVMLLDAVLPFSLPGDNQKEKFDWLKLRLMGDVKKVNDFIRDEILGYQNRFNFFLND